MKKKLHITFLDFDDIKNPLLNAGQARATLEVGKRLVEKGHTITVICSRYPGYKDRTENGIEYKHIGLGSKNIRLNNLFYIFAVPFSVMNIKNTDIIVECFIAPISTLFSPLFTKIPVVALPTSFEAERFSKLYHLPLWIIEKIGCRFYKYFIAFTPYLEQKIRMFNRNIITHIIPQGVSNEYFSIKNKKPEYILYIGRLDMHQKGIDLLLHAYKNISGRTSFPLVVAGDGPDREKIKKLILKLNIFQKVKLVGFADENMKKELFSKAAFVAFPSRSEGFSLLSLETLASGNKLVAFDIPSLIWADKNVALKVKPFDIELYGSIILNESKLSDKKHSEKICRDYAKKYSWENVVDKFENFFLEIVKKESSQ